MTRNGVLDQIGTGQLGRRIRNARLDAGLTQLELAERTVSVGYLSRIESGHRRPGVRAVSKLATALGLTIEELVTGVDQADLSEVQLAVDYAELALTGGEIERAIQEAREAGARAREVHADQLALRARYVQALAEEARGDLDAAILMLEDIVAAQPGGGLASDAGIALSRCYRVTGDFTRSIDSGEGVLALLRQRGQEGTTEFIRLTVTVAGAYAEQGDLGHAIRLCQRCMEAAEKLDSSEALAAAYWNASTFEADRGNNPEAITLAMRALSLLENGGSNRNLARLRSMLGQLHLEGDHPDADRAQELLTVAARELSWTAASPVEIGMNFACQAKAGVMAGDFDRALAALDEIPEVVLDQNPEMAAEKLILKAAVMLATGRREEALSLYDSAALTAQLMGDERRTGRIWFDLGQSYSELGQLELANDAYARAATLYGACQLRLPVASHALARSPTS
jgi:tetratricopeptide (TPR) repeat protein